MKGIPSTGRGDSERTLNRFIARQREREGEREREHANCVMSYCVFVFKMRRGDNPAPYRALIRVLTPNPSLYSPPHSFTPLTITLIGHPNWYTLKGISSESSSQKTRIRASPPTGTTPTRPRAMPSPPTGLIVVSGRFLLLKS